MSAIPAARIPGAGQRVLVFAPHPDDETLGLGGLLHEASRQGAEVRVVFLTNGDGFPLCAAAQYRRWPTRSKMRLLAGERRREAREALTRLGIAADAATFLGYPDRGLASLWLRHWNGEQPFRSPHTRSDSVAEGMYRPGAPYSGEAMLADVRSLLHRFRPDVVYYPDPADDHPDHWAAYCFVQLALEQAREEGIRLPETRRTYLIHRGMWPVPMARRPEWPLEPPVELQQSDVRWERVDLSPAAVEAKQQALDAYSSQLRLVGNFLAAFLRRNELLAEWPAAVPDQSDGEAHLRQAIRQPEGREMLLLAHQAAHPDPNALTPAPGGALSMSMTDCVSDRFTRARIGAVDFTRVDVSRKDAGVTIRAWTRKPLLAWPAYVIYVKPIGAGDAGATREYRVSGYQCQSPGVRYAVWGNSLEVTAPWQELDGAERLLVAVAAWAGPVLLDRTPWRVVELTPNPPPARGVTGRDGDTDGGPSR